MVPFLKQYRSMLYATLGMFLSLLHHKERYVQRIAYSCTVTVHAARSTACKLDVCSMTDRPNAYRFLLVWPEVRQLNCLPAMALGDENTHRSRIEFFFFRATLELPILPDNDENYFHPGRSQTQRNDGI